MKLINFQQSHLCSMQYCSVQYAAVRGLYRRIIKPNCPLDWPQVRSSISHRSGQLRLTLTIIQLIAVTCADESIPISIIICCVPNILTRISHRTCQN